MDEHTKSNVSPTTQPTEHVPQESFSGLFLSFYRAQAWVYILRIWRFSAIALQYPEILEVVAIPQLKNEPFIAIILRNLEKSFKCLKLHFSAIQR